MEHRATLDLQFAVRKYKGHSKVSVTVAPLHSIIRGFLVNTRVKEH